MIGYFLGNLKKLYSFAKTTVATFWVTFGNIWATFYSNIWSHWLQCKIMKVKVKPFFLGRFSGTLTQTSKENWSINLRNTCFMQSDCLLKCFRPIRIRAISVTSILPTWEIFFLGTRTERIYTGPIHSKSDDQLTVYGKLLCKFLYLVQQYCVSYI